MQMLTDGDKNFIRTEKLSHSFTRDYVNISIRNSIKITRTPQT